MFKESPEAEKAFKEAPKARQILQKYYDPSDGMYDVIDTRNEIYAEINKIVPINTKHWNNDEFDEIDWDYKKAMLYEFGFETNEDMEKYLEKNESWQTKYKDILESSEFFRMIDAEAEAAAERQKELPTLPEWRQK